MRRAGNLSAILSAAIAITAGALGPQACARAATRTVVEELIAAQNPCQGLRTEQFGMTIGVDRLKDVRLDTATIRLEGDRLSMELDGRLTCETSPGSGFSGDAAATVRAEAGLTLATCAIDTMDVGLSDFGGSLGPILAAFAPTIEAELKRSAAPKLRDVCYQLRGPVN